MIFDVAVWSLYLPLFIILGVLIVFILGIVIALIVNKRHKK
jgi:hypothetical protein